MHLYVKSWAVRGSATSANKQKYYDSFLNILVGVHKHETLRSLVLDKHIYLLVRRPHTFVCVVFGSL